MPLSRFFESEYEKKIVGKPFFFSAQGANTTNNGNFLFIKITGKYPS